MSVSSHPIEAEVSRSSCSYVSLLWLQRECLVIVFALRHYLLGRHFKLVTDHAPLWWLSMQPENGRVTC